VRCLDITSSLQAAEELKKIGVDPYGIEAMTPKMVNLNILLNGIECRVANIMKQDMLSIGGDVAVARGSVDCSIEKTDVVIIGTLKQIKKFADKISAQPFGLKKIASDIEKALLNTAKDRFFLRTPQREIVIGDRTLIMGIINMTPDSFSDGNMFGSVEEAVKHGVRLEEEGADFIDIGGESTRPGSESVSVDEELKRVVPLVRALKKKIKVPISVDTAKSAVAGAAIEEGAELINDISAMRFDGKMPEVAARHKVPVVLMHMRGVPKTMQEGDIFYRSLLSEVIGFLEESIRKAESEGVKDIIVDPGIGFGKTKEDNIGLLKHLKEFKILGRPILVGTSRKRFIGEITGCNMPSDRIEGTAASVTAAIMNGADIVRVHDVKFMKRVSMIADVVARSV
jgi:dihydropteroate synthase